MTATSKNTFLSIVSPVYMGEEILDELIKRILKEMEHITPYYEIILVEDSSPDNSWQKIVNISKKNPNIKGIKLSRNFGQHYAIAAGLFHAKGEYIIVMDCDLQDDPIYIKDLVNKAKEGYDVVFTVKEKREHNKIKNFFSFCFQIIFNWLLGTNKNLAMSGKIGGFSLITQKVKDAYCSMRDYYRPYLVLIQWLGFKATYITIQHRNRFKGKTSYSFKKLIFHAVNGIISQTDRLLILAIYIGTFFTIIGLLAISYIIIKSISGTSFKPGWPSIIITIIFSTGLILITLGIMGIYISKIFQQTKNRPFFVIDEKINV